MGEDTEPAQNPHPLTDHKKMLLVITLATPTSAQNLVEIRPRGGGASAQIGELYSEIFIYLTYTFFTKSATGQTRRRIFTLDGSNVAE